MKLPTEPFTYRRRVAFGDCDPARIYYAPRAVDYAVEAVEAWHESVLGVSWTEWIERHRLEPDFTRIDCEYFRPLLPDQVVRVRVWVVGNGRETLTFLAAGEDDSGKRCFRVRLEGRFLERGTGSPAPVPAKHRERIEEYRVRCGGNEDALSRTGRTEGIPPRKPKAGGKPFTRMRRVLYGECGPSGKIYPPKVFEYAVEVVGEWYEEVAGVSWLTLIAVRGQGAPWVSAGCAFLAPMVPGQEIRVTVRVTRLGRSSIGFSVTGEAGGGEACFEAEMTACLIDQEAGFRPMPVPEEMAERIRAYRAASGDEG
ncbi:MAG: hypothetical protein A2X88_09345 [Deltaproteobacteria bacterium GWC2_65_14]|nr:MAG: hypothetical protein A2X88_09345 [Deltaproteobacteria bacterium GWC2_65_14]